MSSRQPGRCLWCDSTDVRKVQSELPASDAAEQGPASDVPYGPQREWSCGNCGRSWSHLPLKIRSGEVVDTERGQIKATSADVAWVRQIRAFLLEIFAQQRHVNVAELKEHVGLPHGLDGVGHLLQLLTEDCRRRGEPSLSDLVDGVAEPSDENAGPSTELISQGDINDLLDGVYGETEPRDKPDPAPEPV